MSGAKKVKVSASNPSRYCSLCGKPHESLIGAAYCQRRFHERMVRIPAQSPIHTDPFEECSERFCRFLSQGKGK